MKIFYLPDLGEGLPEAEIREWLVQEGDAVIVDQPIVSMETAKAVVEVPAPRSGRIIKLYGKAGELISTGAPLVEFEDGNQRAESSTVAGSLETGNLVLEENAAGIQSTKSMSGNFLKALPAVRALAKRLNVDLASVTPTGINQQITAEDVEKAAQAAVKPQEGYESLRGVRRAMALGMIESHREIVPVTLIDDATLAGKNLDDITLCVIRAIIAGCKAEPALNTWFDGKTLARRLWDEIHLGLAMDSVEGLFVPVLKDVENMPAKIMRETINRYKEEVKNRTIATENMRGATFVLSNFGTFAGRYANPIVMPPTVAILGTGRLREQPFVQHGQIVIQNVLPLSLTFDHRAITGGEASRFLAAVIKNLEEIE